VPALLRLRDRFEIVAMHSRTQTSAAALAEQIGGAVVVVPTLDELLARPDVAAVDIVLPIDVQAGAVAAALIAGKHVSSEKPIAPDSATARRLMALHAARPGQVWMVAENWRYEEAFVRAAELLADGAIGQPVAFHWALYNALEPANKYYQTAWRRSGSFPGGFLLDGGVHYVAALRLLLGEIAEVTGVVRSVRADLPPADTLAATLHFASGAVGTLLVTFAVGSPWGTPLTIAGTAGSLRVDRGRIELARAGAEVEAIECARYNGVERELAAFVDAVRLGAPLRNTPAAGLEDLMVMERVLGAPPLRTV
jgi:predicted dehydrogenase